MNDKQQLAAMGEHIQEEISWRNKEAPNGLKRFMTEKQYKKQSAEIKQYYEPYRCAKCIQREFKVPDGWKLVPEAITERMWDAMNESHCSPASWYLAAIENAPEYKP